MWAGELSPLHVGEGQDPWGQLLLRVPALPSLHCLVVGRAGLSP